MLRTLAVLCLFGSVSICYSQEAIEGLPKAHYHSQPSDPAWMKYAVQLHGHLGPMLTFGARMGMAARKAVDADGNFDVEITCEGPFPKTPASCFLDGLQISTGATLGKRNLHYVECKDITIRIKNTRSGKIAEIRPKVEFLSLLPDWRATDKPSPGETKKTGSDSDHDFDDLARKIAVMPENEIVEITYPKNK
jgi:formylmethanofuran dehydrogenase subunit E